MKKSVLSVMSYASIGLMGLIILSSCAHYYYVQNAHNVPMFRDKNEYRVSAAGGWGDESASVELQGAMSVSKHIALATDLMVAFKGAQSGGHDNRGSGTYFSAAVGYFRPLGEHFVFETYGGAGLASETHQYSYYDWNSGTDVNAGSASLAFSKFYLQPSMGFSIPWLDFAVSARLSRIYFNKIEDNTIDYEPYGLQELMQTRGSFLIEPAFTIRAGLDTYKVQFQYAHIFNLTDPDLNFELPKFSLGMIFLFSRPPAKVQ